MVNFIGGHRKMSGWRSVLWQDLRIQAFENFGLTVPTKVVELVGYFQVVLIALQRGNKGLKSVNKLW